MQNKSYSFNIYEGHKIHCYLMKGPIYKTVYAKSCDVVHCTVYSILYTVHITKEHAFFITSKVIFIFSVWFNSSIFLHLSAPKRASTLLHMIAKSQIYLQWHKMERIFLVYDALVTNIVDHKKSNLLQLISLEILEASSFGQTWSLTNSEFIETLTNG